MASVKKSTSSINKAVSPCKSYYLRLENLPWSASHKDIHDFFKEVTIPTGGIFYHNADAIVAFLSEEDRNTGLEMNDKCIKDSFIHLTTLEREDLRRIRRENVRRVLRFPKPADPNQRTLKRIRPTFKPEDISETFSIFNPVETDTAPACKDIAADPKVRRKIKPTLLKDVSNLCSSFYDDEGAKLGQHCAKKIKIDEALLLAPICTV